MNETIANSTSSLRTGKDLLLDSPLLNLILAASFLSKITRSKSTPPSYARTPPFPLRYSENYYNTLPWYPYNAQHYFKLQTSLNAQQTTFPIKQHIIQIHQRPITEKTEVDEISNEHLTTTSPITFKAKIPEDSDDFVNPNKNDFDTNLASGNLPDEISPSSQLTQELKDFLTDFFKKTYPTANQVLHTFGSTQNSDETADELKPVDFSETLPGINLEQISEEITDNITQVTSDKIVENMSETLVDNMADNLPKNATKSEVQQMSQNVLQNLPSSILENIPPHMLEQISEMISEQVSEKLTEKSPKDASNHMLEKVAQLIPVRTAENNPGQLEASDENKILKLADSVHFIENGKVSENVQKTHKGLSDDTESSNLVSAASNVDLQASETQKTNTGKSSKNSKTTDDEYVLGGTVDDEDDDEDEEDIVDESEVEIEQSLPQRVSPKFSPKMRFTAVEPSRKGSQGKTSNQQVHERINSKKPSPKRKTTPISLIYDEYDESAPKRKVQFHNGVVKKTNSRKPSRPFQSDYFDETQIGNDEEESGKPQRQVQNKKGQGQGPKIKSSQRKRTTSTTPSYADDYYNDPVDSDQNQNQYSDQDQTQDYNDEPPIVTPKPRPQRPSKATRRPILRQQDATTEIPTTTEIIEETTLSPTSSTSTTTQTTSTSGEYPYYGNNNYNNISITYGPPINNYGYGPSNGNEQISFTYAPPSSSGNGNLGGFSGISGGGASASGVAPMVDNWYNQYAKASMYKRIQDLLTPNNFYNQYDLNYHDGSVQ